MQNSPATRTFIPVTGLSNREFLERYAGPGRIGLSGGNTLVDQAICRAQRHLDDEENWGLWSHAFFFQGRRADGHHWVIESDLQVMRKHIQLGVQENRVEKYWDEKLYTRLAVLDFGLSEEQVGGLLSEALGLVANRARYSLRELVGTLIALTFLLTLEDPHRFRKSRDVGGYLGLQPGRRKSGESEPQLHISKEGDPYLRTLLVQGAQHILGPDATPVTGCPRRHRDFAPTMPAF